MVKIKDIAKKAGVSISTVSRALNQSGYVKDDTRELVMQAADELGYKKRGHTYASGFKTIGVVVSDVAHPFFSKVLRGIMDVAETSNIGVLIKNAEEDAEKEEAALQALIDMQVDGVILHPSGILGKYGTEYLENLQNLSTPVVLIDREVKCFDVNGVFVDSVKGCYKAVDLLLKEGHEDIAILVDPKHMRSAIERMKGCEQAFIDNGKKINKELVFHGDITSESGYKITKQIMAMENRPSAIFVTNNLISVGCIKALVELNVDVPKDIAVIGFDDYKSSNTFYNFTAIRRHTAQMGEAACQLLLQLMDEGKPGGAPQCVILTPTLIRRGSELYVKGEKNEKDESVSCR